MQKINHEEEEKKEKDLNRKIIENTYFRKERYFLYFYLEIVKDFLDIKIVKEVAKKFIQKSYKYIEKNK